MAWILENIIILICFILGAGLIVLEAFMPGFGVPGISGIVLQLIALWQTWVKYGTMTALIALCVSVVVTGCLVLLALRSAAKGKLGRSKLFLQENETPVSPQETQQEYLGKVGTTVTALRPSGIAEFEGKRLNVVSDGLFVEAGTKVEIRKCDGGRLVAAPVEQ